jgi:hypothetical protein
MKEFTMMIKGLLPCFVIFASLGTFLIEPHLVLPAEQSPKERNQPTPAAKKTNQKPPAPEDVKKSVEEVKKDDTDKTDKPDSKPECVTGMKALSRPFSEPCQHPTLSE